MIRLISALYVKLLLDRLTHTRDIAYPWWTLCNTRLTTCAALATAWAQHYVEPINCGHSFAIAYKLVSQPSGIDTLHTIDTNEWMYSTLIFRSVCIWREILNYDISKRFGKSCNTPLCNYNYDMSKLQNHQFENTRCLLPWAYCVSALSPRVGLIVCTYFTCNTRNIKIFRKSPFNKY